MIAHRLFRRTDRNLGAPRLEIPTRVRLALDDAAVWIESGMDDDEAAVLFGHRLVSIHPLPNGNGRHSRLASDCLAEALGRPRFAWGRGADIGAGGQVRAQYLSAVRAADRGDITPPLAFART